MKPALPLSFPPFRLDLVNECLWREGQRIPLRGKTFKALCCLLEHPGQLVSKATLFKVVWSDTYVSDSVLMTCISELRKALGDDGKRPQFIETVHRRGYRFIGTARRPGSGVQSHKSEPTPSRQSLVSNFVGREAEIAQLHKWLEKALGGERQLVFISGEPGIGKTAVMEAFLAQVAAEGRVWIGRGQCIEHYGAGEGYMPVLEAMGRLCRAPGGDRLIVFLGQYAPTWLVQMPALLSAAQRKRLPREVQGATRERMLREMAEAVEALTAERPLVLGLEDLHWSDVSTLDWLAYLAQRQERARLLVLGTYRPVEMLENGHPLRAVTQELQLHRQCKELPLTLLSETAVMEYLAGRFGVETQQVASLQRLARLIYHRTEGNPLFIVNVVEDIVVQGGLHEIDSQRNLSAAVEAVVREVPTSIRQMIERQIDRLRPEEQQALEVASVAGAEFSAAAVAAGAETAVAEVEACCTGLARREQFVRAKGISEWPDGTVAARYEFLHALYREVVYERVPAGQRASLHHKIGERQVQAYGEQAREIAAALAVHFEEGRDYCRAVHYHARAAENAIQRQAGQEAILHLTTAIKLLQTQPDTVERARQEILLQFNLRVQIGRLKGEAAPELEEIVARVRDLGQRLEPTPQLFWALTGVYLFYVVREELHAAQALAKQHLHMAQRFPDPLFAMAAYSELGIVCFFLGELVSARTYLEQAVALYDPRPPHPFSVDWEHGPPCLCFSAFVLWHLGYPDQALHSSAAALVRTRELHLPYMHAFALNCTARLHQLRHESDVAYERAAHAVQLATDQGFAGLVEMGRIFVGGTLTESSKSEDAIGQIRQGMTAYRTLGGETFRSYYLALLAEACGRAGRVTEGLAAVEEALATTQRTGGRYYEAELYRLKGELSLQSGVRSPRSAVTSPQTEAEAEAGFHKAIEIARHQQAKSLELRAVMSLSRLWQRQGKKKPAQRMLTEIYNWFTEGFDTKDLQEAKALLEKLA
ncbi:MAG TPA: AAA family ATPase [Candidatus Binatia bacterium]|nr:AAA family ATPase [Candidatus Binatia bacterium]